jgi:multidrug resistance efflux pump
MTRQTTLLLALGMLIASALAVGVSGWILVLRDRHHVETSVAAVAADPEGTEGS